MAEIYSFVVFKPRVARSQLVLAEALVHVLLVGSQVFVVEFVQVGVLIIEIGVVLVLLLVISPVVAPIVINVKPFIILLLVDLFGCISAQDVFDV